MLPNAHTAEPNNTAPARSDTDREITALADKAYSSSATRADLRHKKLASAELRRIPPAAVVVKG